MMSVVFTDADVAKLRLIKSVGRIMVKGKKPYTERKAELL